mgnify:CR=1 FL=1
MQFDYWKQNSFIRLSIVLSSFYLFCRCIADHTTYLCILHSTYTTPRCLSLLCSVQRREAWYHQHSWDGRLHRATGSCSERLYSSWWFDSAPLSVLEVSRCHRCGTVWGCIARSSAMWNWWNRMITRWRKRWNPHQSDYGCVHWCNQTRLLTSYADHFNSASDATYN